jgi:uncharacterized integral membrane protein
MFRKIVNALVLIPLTVIFIAFAIANRHLVMISFDPFNSSDPSLAITLPLFIIIIAIAILGVIAGGVATWFRQGHWRRAARQHEAAARDAQAQLAGLQASRTVSPHNVPTPLPALPRRAGGFN